MNEPKETTLHQRILTDIEGRIVSGEWPPGYRIPFEIELTKQYDCSRMTVNKALSQLVKSGLIERRKKSGSFVIQPQAQSAVLEIHDIKAEVQSLNLAYSYKVAKRIRRKAQAQDRQMLDLQQNSRSRRNHLHPLRWDATVLPGKAIDQPANSAGSRR